MVGEKVETLPAVVAPGFSDEPSHDDDHLREGNPEGDDSTLTLRTPSELLVGVVPGVNGPLHYPPLRGLKRGRLTLLGDLCAQPTLFFEPLAGGLRVVSAVEVDAYPPGQLSQRLSYGVQSLGKQRRVVMGWRG